MVRVKKWGKSSQGLIVILNLGKPYGLKDQIYQVVFILIAARYNLGGRSLEFISDNKSR